MSMEIIVGSRGIGKTQRLIDYMIKNNIHHIFCGNPEKMRERIHLAGGKDIAIYHYSDISSMEEFDDSGVAYVIDDLRETMEYKHPRCFGTTLSI